MFEDVTDQQDQFLEMFLQYLDGTLSPRGDDEDDDRHPTRGRSPRPRPLVRRGCQDGAGGPGAVERGADDAAGVARALAHRVQAREARAPAGWRGRAGCAPGRWCGSRRRPAPRRGAGSRGCGGTARPAPSRSACGHHRREHRLDAARAPRPGGSWWRAASSLARPARKSRRRCAGRAEVAAAQRGRPPARCRRWNATPGQRPGRRRARSPPAAARPPGRRWRRASRAGTGSCR